jgi:hypothetical protein
VVIHQDVVHLAFAIAEVQAIFTLHIWVHRQGVEQLRGQEKEVIQCGALLGGPLREHGRLRHSVHPFIHSLTHSTNMVDPIPPGSESMGPEPTVPNNLR